jgi:hypothetical protein
MLRISHCLDSRLTVNCEILATCISTYSLVRTSQAAHSVSIKKSYPPNRPWRPIGLWDVEDPTLCRQSAHSGTDVSRKRRPLSSPQNIFSLLLVLIYVRGRVKCRCLVWPEGLDILKKFIHLIWSGSHDLPACSRGSQQTMLVLAPHVISIHVFHDCGFYIIYLHTCLLNSVMTNAAMLSLDWRRIHWKKHILKCETSVPEEGTLRYNVKRRAACSFETFLTIWQTMYHASDDSNF